MFLSENAPHRVTILFLELSGEGTFLRRRRRFGGPAATRSTAPAASPPRGRGYCRTLRPPSGGRCFSFLLLLCRLVQLLVYFSGLGFHNQTKLVVVSRGARPYAHEENPVGRKKNEEDQVLPQQPEEGLLQQLRHGEKEEAVHGADTGKKRKQLLQPFLGLLW
jgi:hypothetical protein